VAQGADRVGAAGGVWKASSALSFLSAPTPPYSNHECGSRVAGGAADGDGGREAAGT
jgi:hypothetical protein